MHGQPGVDGDEDVRGLLLPTVTELGPKEKNIERKISKYAII